MAPLLRKNSSLSAAHLNYAKEPVRQLWNRPMPNPLLVGAVGLRRCGSGCPFAHPRDTARLRADWASSLIIAHQQGCPRHGE